MAGDLATFLGISAIVIVTLGQDMALVLRNALLRGRRSGLMTSLGVTTGPATWAVATSLGLVFCALTLAWPTGYALAVARAGDVLRRPTIRRALDAVMGAVLVTLGLRLATTPR